MGKTNVALLAEGVDRNTPPKRVRTAGRRSPSSRRAWIEISQYFLHGRQILVALLAEGVDRNVMVRPFFMSVCGRPPRGGRG